MPLNPSRLPKWQQVLVQIEHQFDQGVFEPHQPFPTLGEISSTYGVSDITARRVFRELKSQGRIITQGRRGTFIAPFLQKQTVYMCLPKAQLSFIASASPQETSFFSKFFEHYHRQGFDQQFEIKMISIEFCLRNPAAIADCPLFVTMESLLNVYDGKVEINQERLALVQQHGKAIVFRSLMGMVDGVDQVSVDFRHAFEQIVHYLADLGHQHIGMLCGMLSNLWLKPRFEGFLNALSSEGLTCDPRLVEITNGIDPQQDYDAVERILTQSPRATAIVCANDSRAIHVLEYCKAKGIAVPDDLAIVGFDNSIEGALCTPALTTMDVGVTQIANAMFEMVERQSHGLTGKHQREIIQPRLIERDTTQLTASLTSDSASAIRALSTQPMTLSRITKHI